MEINLSKKTVFSILIFFWIVFSITYIIWDVWTDFKQGGMIAAYERGRMDTISILISEAEKCEPVSVVGEEKEISVIALDCLTENSEK
jgi:hypothetical protein